MSYSSYDLSVSSGSPAELYRFVYNGSRLNYCTVDGGLTEFSRIVDGVEEVFTPTTITHGGSEITEESARSTLEITVPSTFPIAKLFISAPPEGIISVTVMRFHMTDSSHEYITVFKGRVLSCSFNEDHATILCEPIFTSLKRPGLAMRYESSCNYDLFSKGCGLTRSDWEIRGSVTEASGLTLKIPAAAAHADGYFVGGLFQNDSVRRMITGNSGDTITLMHPVPSSLVLGLDCLIHPGCDHTRSVCGSKFSNAINFGGFPWLPYKNPYSGDNIFW